MPNFPSSISTDSNLYIAVNNLATTLTDNPLTAGATTVHVSSTTGFPSAGFISIDSEIIAYTGLSGGNSFTGCTRGADGTTAASHSMSVQVFHNIVAAHHNVIKNEIEALEQVLQPTFIGLGRNRILNGEMIIDQRNVGALITVNSASTFYSADHWMGQGSSAGAFTLQRVTDVPNSGGFRNSIITTITSTDLTLAANVSYRIIQPMEGNFLADFRFGFADAQALFLSFWVKGSMTGTYGGSILNGTENRSYPFSFTINNANTWEQKTIAISGDTAGTWSITTAIGMEVMFSLGANSAFKSASPNVWQTGKFYSPTGTVDLIQTLNATINFTGVQLEIGTNATAFEHIPLDLLIHRCERYFEKSYPLETALGSVGGAEQFTTTSAGGANTSYGSTRPFHVEKRTAPSMTAWSNNGDSGTWQFFTSAGGATLRNPNLSSTVKTYYTFQVVASEVFASGHFTANSELL